MHWPGIEPGSPAWEARILPLNHQCLDWQRWAQVPSGGVSGSFFFFFFFFFFGKTSFYGPTTDRELPGVLGFSICDSEMRMKH